MSLIVTQYGNLYDLQSKIIAVYVKELEKTIQVNKNLLDRKDWAMDGGEYHTQCRKSKRDEIKNCKSQIKLLKHSTP